MDIEFTDENKRTVLHHAAQNGHEEATRELLRFEADFSTLDRIGETAFKKAEGRNDGGIVAILSGRWKDTEAATRQNCILLKYATGSGDDTLFERVMLKRRSDAKLLTER